jgi:phage tail sheath gpL-like
LGVAKALAAAANVSGSPVTAKVSGDSIALTSTTAGTAGNIAYTATDSSDFTVSPGSGSLSGGVNAGTTDEYDAGTVQAMVGGITASSNWGKTSTDETLAKALASSLNALAKGAFTATASQNTVTITPAPGNSVPGVTANVEDSMGFSPASFAASTSN